MPTCRRRDRVGLISFGGILRWLVPGTGIVQLYRIIDALLDTQIFLSYYWKEIDVIPRRDAAAERARDRALAAARSALGRRAARPPGARLRPRGRSTSRPCRSRRGPTRGLDARRLRHLDAAARRAPPPSAARRRRRRRVGHDRAPAGRSSRRCGNSGATPGTRASDHRRRRRSSRWRERAPTPRPAAAGSPTSRSVRRVLALALLALGLVLRWPATIPWAVVIAAGRLRRRRARASRSSTAGRP